MKRNILLVASLTIAAALSVRAETIIALTSGNRLLVLDSATPDNITRMVAITGLVSGENLRAIDCRPRTGELFALGGTEIYTINTDTGVAQPLYPFGFFALNGTRFGFDFDPTEPRATAFGLEGDMIRATTVEGSNLRLHPQTSSFSVTDSDLQYAATDPHAGANPHVVGSAYTNSFSGSRATVLYDLDSNFDILTIQNPPNEGTLHTIGSLGVDTTDNVGFDVSGSTGVAYASLTVGTVTGLYTVDLITGSATALGPIGNPAAFGTETVIGIAAYVPPASRLMNLSGRGRVGGDNDVLIGGFITRSGFLSRYLLRAIGPSLSRFAVGALMDPVLTLYDDNGHVIATNDDWRSFQELEITATGLAPANDAESAILTILEPSGYTAIVSGKGSDAGIALVEIYQLQ
jgi:hypothetical protein